GVRPAFRPGPLTGGGGTPPPGTPPKPGTNRRDLMPRRDTPLPPGVERRQDVFPALVEAHDREMSPAPSPEVVGRRCDLTPEEVRQIERGGLEGTWPPL